MAIGLQQARSPLCCPSSGIPGCAEAQQAASSCPCLAPRDFGSGAERGTTLTGRAISSALEQAGALRFSSPSPVGGCAAPRRPLEKCFLQQQWAQCQPREWELCFQQPSPSGTHLAVAGLQLPPPSAKHHLDATLHQRAVRIQGGLPLRYHRPGYFQAAVLFGPVWVETQAAQLRVVARQAPSRAQ